MTTTQPAPARGAALLRPGEDIKPRRARIVPPLRGLGRRPSVSDSNFVFFGPLEDASDVWGRLLARGVLVRDVGTPHPLRVTAGTEPETTAF
ncbi:histidinol-phosphate transaminase, partial [Micrococcus luteus]